MMILQWSILLFLTINVPNIRCLFYENCLHSEKCKNVVEIQTLQESEEGQKYNPLYLIGKKSSYQLAVPHALKTDNTNDEKTNVEVHFTGKEELIYACPKNSINDDTREVSSALAQQNDIKISKQYQIVGKACEERVKPTMRSLNKTCGISSQSESPDPDNKFQLYEIGFKVFIRHRSIMDRIKKLIRKKETEKFNWHTLYEICHDTETLSTLYTIHTLHGASVGATSEIFSGTFHDISVTESIDGTGIENPIGRSSVSKYKTFYEEKSVQDLFKELFGLTKSETYFIKEEDRLVIGHLVPDVDMSFIPWKNATYLYINVVPIWQAVHNGVWKSIETNIRELAKKIKETLTIYTGVHKTLSYLGDKIFLGGKGTSIMPVPLNLWKVVHSKKKNEAIALLVINDPHTNSYGCPQGNDQNICHQSGWLRSDHINQICCYQVEKLREVIPYIPDIQNAKLLKL